LAEQLTAAGVPADLVRDVLSAGPDLADLALRVFAACMASKRPPEKPVGFLIGMLKRPERYGIVRGPDGWQAPPDAEALKRRRLEELAARRRQHQAAETQERRAADAAVAREQAVAEQKFDHENRLWAGLGAAEREAIAAAVTASACQPGLFGVRFAGDHRLAGQLRTFDTCTHFRRFCLAEMYRRHPELKGDRA